MMKLIFKKEMLKRIFSVGIALVIASLAEYYFSFSHDYLIPLTAVFVMLTSIGNLLYQSAQRFILILAIVVLLSLALPPYHVMYLRIYDVCFGAVIGVIINLCVFPRRADSEFRAAVLPILQSYQLYFMAIVNLLFDNNKSASIESQKITVEYELQHLPTWVYARGFDMGLQKGHQYFLMKLHQIAEILFAMHHAARGSFNEEILYTMREPVFECVERMNIFFQALATVFELKKLSEGVEDFETQLIELDNKFQTLLPLNLDILALTNEDVYFYEFIYALGDLRKALLKLAQALR